MYNILEPKCNCVQNSVTWFLHSIGGIVTHVFHISGAWNKMVALSLILGINSPMQLGISVLLWSILGSFFISKLLICNRAALQNANWDQLNATWFISLSYKTPKQINMPSSCLLTGADSSGITGCVSSASVAPCKIQDKTQVWTLSQIISISLLKMYSAGGWRHPISRSYWERTWENGGWSKICS